MSRPMLSLRATSRFYPDPAAMGSSLPPSTRTAAYGTEPCSKRADRLVPPPVAAHYLRQGERLAEAIMVLHGVIHGILHRLRSAGSEKDRHRTLTIAR